MAIRDELAQAARDCASDYGGCRVLPAAAAAELARRFQADLAAVYAVSLEAGVMPLRYARNLGTCGFEGQLALLRATVAVVGLGGLGGFIVDGLARMGVGRLIAIDGDVFEEHNLNRQLLSTEVRLGTAKADAAVAHVAAINGAVKVVPHRTRLTRDNATDLLGGADVVVDALDSLPNRLLLQDAAASLGVPMVHGAIAGFIGQVMVILPGDPGLRALYPGEVVPEKGIEQASGNPAATPMIAAGLEIQEVVKLITGRGTALRHRLLMFDTEHGFFEHLELAK